MLDAIITTIIWAAAISCALVVIAYLFLRRFESPISGLIRRIRRIDRKGAEFDPAEIQKSKAKSADDDGFTGILDSAVLREQETIVRDALSDRKDASQTETIDFLVGRLAEQNLSIQFEYINGIIYGSQIQVLRFLNSNPGGAEGQDFRFCYENAAQQFPIMFSNYPFDEYVEFLVSNELIAKESKRYKISPMGKEFLRYLVTTGRTRARPY